MISQEGVEGFVDTRGFPSKSITKVQKFWETTKNLNLKVLINVIPSLLRSKKLRRIGEKS